MEYFGGLLTTCSRLFGDWLCLILVVYYGRLVRSEVVDYFKVLFLDFVITSLIVLADIYVLICWQLDEMFEIICF